MTKFVEMDDRVKFKEQIGEENKEIVVDGQVILINKFNVNPDKVEQFVKDWGKDATKFKQQPGFISVQLHKGIGKSSVFIVYAVWESIEHYKEAVNKLVYNPESQPRLLKYDDNSLVMSPHLFKKIAVPGICGD
jgi:quinol monooxygenase YgiN